MGGERRREVGGGRKEIMQKMARATARPPKFVAAMGHLVKGTRGVLCPIIYRANPLSRAAAVTENDGDDAVDDEQDDENEDVASRWARDARRLCDWQNIHPSLDVAHALGGAVPEERAAVARVVHREAPVLELREEAGRAPLAVRQREEERERVRARPAARLPRHRRVPAENVSVVELHDRERRCLAVA